MTTFVLVPGAWLGGWCWKQVVPLLRGEGHEVYTLTLTGLGERAHLARPEVNLETHITDVVNVFEYEDLCNVVLLGHSYAGVVITGVADRIPDRLSQLVYLDTGPLLDGVALIDTYPTEARRHVERQVEELGDGWRLPMPPWDELAEQASLAGLDNQQRILMRSRSVAQPFGTYTQPLQLKNPAREAVPRLGILCSFSLDQVQEMVALDHPLFRGLTGPNWRFVELPTGHWPMFSRPEDLTRLILAPPSDPSTRDASRRGS